MSYSNNANAASSPNDILSHNINSFNSTHVSLGVTDERSEILAWLSPIEPGIRHQNIRTRRADTVGEWLLQTDEFKSWCNGASEDGSEHAALLCCGGPGVGKTYFSSLVVDRLCDRAREGNIAVACFYVDFAAREEQSPTNILGSLLKQIVGGLQNIPEEISQTYQDYKKVIGGRRLRVPEIVKMLQVVASPQQTFICVDALDECVEAHRPEVLDSLRQILQRCPKTRIFITGRQHIRGEIEKHLAGRVSTLSVKASSDDVVGYIRMRLSKDTYLDVMDSVLEAQIIKTISENIPETFLLVSLITDAILGEPTAYGRRQKLRALTDGLDLKDVYGATLERIKAQGGERARVGMAALMWISHSERLLQLDELLHGLAVEIGSTYLNLESVPSVEILLSSSLGLIAVDEEVSTVRLIHFTLQEYLYTCSDLFGATHSVMAETCLTYLNFEAIKETPPTLFSLPQSTPFLNYSSLYWGAHARRKVSADVVSLALKLFRQIETHISTKLLLAHLISRADRYRGDIPTNGHLAGFTGLHCASIFGIVEIATILVNQQSNDPNKRDFLGISPLIWAAICGREEVVKLLLDQPTLIPDKPDNYFRRTALSWAARKGHEKIVRLLLCRASYKPDDTHSWWARAPRAINMAIGKRYVNPNRSDKSGQTPILLAAEDGHEGVVRLLLGRKDVKPDATDVYGRTAVFWASTRGRERVVDLLLQRKDVKINRPDKNGQTLLFLAVGSGYSGVVGLLLGRKDINPNAKSKAGQTSLSLASEKGYRDIVELLLGSEDVDPNKPNNDGQTPLMLAARNGQNEVVALLLGRKDVRPNMPDKHGKTPLRWASSNGHDRVVELLLGREDVNPNIPDKHGRTPLSWAAGNGSDRATELLLGREDISPDIPDNNGRTPLSWAAGNGCGGAVKLLLGREDVNPNMPDNSGRVPLLLALQGVKREATKLLLRWENVNPNIPDNNGQTPLLVLVMRLYRNEELEILLGREDANPNIPDKQGRTPLSWAAGSSRDRTELLLGREDISPDIPDNNGRTPLSWAAENGYSGAVKLLLGREDVNPNMPDNRGRAPLSWAAEKGHDGVVKLLLEREDINPNILDDRGQTPLSWAARNGHEQVVKLL